MKNYRFLFLVVFFFIFFTNKGLAQDQQKVDSLKRLLSRASSDSIKIDMYLLLHKEYIKTDTIQAVKYINDAIFMSKKNDDKIRICKAYLKLCNYQWKKGNLQQANQALLVVKEQLMSFNDKTIEATFYMESGIVNYIEGSYSLAVDNFFKALTNYEILDDNAGVAKCYTNIGICYWQLNNLDKALNYYMKAADRQKGKSDEMSLSKTLGNIGLIYRGKNDYKKALEYYLKSLEINRKYNMEKNEAVNLQNIGALYSFLKEYDKSLRYYKDAKKVCEAINDKRGILYADHGVASVYINIENYNKGIPLLEKSLSLAENLNVNEEIKNISLDASEAYEKIGDYNKSLKHRKSFEFWKDSLTNKSHLDKVKELELKFETAKKDKEIILLTKENEIQQAMAERQATFRNALIGGILLLVAIAGLIFYTLRQRLKNQKLVAAKNEEIKISNLREQLGTLEMKALRAQMNPHFLFNCMNSINRMIISEDNDNASKYLTKFSKLVRLMLENSENPKVTLKDELEMLKSYIQLESIRFKNKMDYKINVAESIDKESTYLPSMVLQPFVENAIWHGLLHKESKGLLTIDIIEEDDYLRCSITDNGVGREKSLKLQKQSGFKKKSMGIKITVDRLKLMTRQKINEVINIIDLKDNENKAVGTQVDILIPIS